MKRNLTLLSITNQLLELAAISTRDPQVKSVANENNTPAQSITLSTGGTETASVNISTQRTIDCYRVTASVNEKAVLSFDVETNALLTPPQLIEINQALDQHLPEQQAA